MLIAGELLPERTYKYMIGKEINSVISYQNQFIYTDNHAIFSNAWAGSLYKTHELKTPTYLAGGKNFDFLVSDGKSVVFAILTENFKLSARGL